MEFSSAAAHNGKSGGGETTLCDIIETELTQQTQQEVQSRTEQEQVVTEEPRLSLSKRPRVSENDNLSASQSTGNARFGKSCK